MGIYLASNRVKSDTCTVGDYKIEWRLDSRTGEAVFISGEGTDEQLQAIHPFNNEPVIGGLLYPVIIYAYLDGEKYTLTPEAGAKYSPDFLYCLPSVTVDTFNCSNGNGSYYGGYTHEINYFNAVDPAQDASREYRFDLSSDGSTNFFAWYFNGFSVTDRITIMYYHINDINNPDVITDWKVGSNQSGYNWNTTPIQYDYASIRYVIDLQPYNFVDGDYLIIKVEPRVDEPENDDTNWRVYMACLSTFDDNTYSDSMRVIDTSTISMVWDSEYCAWDLSWNNKANYDLPDHYRTFMDSRALDYLEINYHAGDWYDKTNHKFHVYFRDNSDTLKHSVASYPTCTALSGTQTVAKTNNVIVMSHTDEADYLIFKGLYNNIINDTDWANQSSDPYDRSYWNHIYFSFRDASTCGDTYDYYVWYVWNQSSWEFDDVNYTITITLSLDGVSNITAQECDDIDEEIATLVSTMNGTYNLADFSYQTNVIKLGLVGRSLYERANQDTYINFRFDYAEYSQKMFGVTPTGWTDVHNGYNSAVVGWGLLLQSGKAEITNMSDPVNNFRIISTCDTDGSYKDIDDPDNIVYEISGGVVTIPTTTTTL